MQSRFLILFLTSLLLSPAGVCSCSSLTGPSGQLLWERPISEGKLIDGQFANYCVGSQVIVLGNTGKPTIYSCDVNTGEVKWRWNDWYLSHRVVQIFYVWSSNDILVVSSGAYNYGIQIQSGQTLWRTTGDNRDESANFGATGIGTKYFFPALGTKIFVGDIFTGKEEELLNFPRATGPRSPVPAITAIRDTMLIIPSVYGEAATNFKNKTYLTLFNFSRRQKVYDILQAQSDSLEFNVMPDGLPVVSQNRIFSALGRGVQCNDLETGKLLWRTKTDADFWLSGVIVCENSIVGNSSNGTLYCLNSENGTILWQIKTSGSTKTPFYMNGIIYLIGGGDGLLYAIDASDGKVLWKTVSPDNASNKQTFFTGVVTGKDGKIYASSYLNLYCYKAAR
jgi:outer membrane protein assembly factor BamB